MSSIWSSLTNLLRWVYRPSSSVPLITPEPVRGEAVPSSLETNVDNAQPEELTRGWEWIISSAERDLEKVVRDQQIRQSMEIRQLRKVSRTVAYRPLILQYVANLYSRLDRTDSTILLDSRLESSLRSGIFRDFLAKVSEEWEDVVRQLLLHDLAMRELRQLPTEVPYHQLAEELVESLSTNWIEEKYKKNVVGELKASALQASNSAEVTGLTTKILSDILWTFSLTLSRTTSTWFVPPRSLTQIETGYLVSIILNSAIEIVNLWISTARNSELAKDRIGKIPEQWKVEEKREKEREKEEKLKGKVIDAKYHDNERNKIDRKEDFKSMRDKLSTLLTFKPVKKEREMVKIDDFQLRRQILMKKLQGTL